MAAAVGVVEAVQQRLGAFAGEPGADVVACQARAEGQRVRGEHRAARLLGLDRRQVDGLGRLLLQLEVRDVAVLRGEHAGDGGGQRAAGGAGRVVLDDGRLRASLGDDEVAQVAGRRRWHR
jgi:hypothetical protein